MNAIQRLVVFVGTALIIVALAVQPYRVTVVPAEMAANAPVNDSSFVESRTEFFVFIKPPAPKVVIKKPTTYKISTSSGVDGSLGSI